MVIGRADIERVLTPSIALDLVSDAMRSASRGNAKHLVRRILQLPSPEGILGDMPGSLGANAAFGLKCISVLASRPATRAPHRGFLVLFEPSKGLPVAVLEAGSITAIRTAAATALATRTFARRSSRRLAIFGAGEQAEHHIAALVESWPFEEVLIWARRPADSKALATKVQARNIVNVRTEDSGREAANADVICTLTSSEEPVLFGEWVSPGSHVNLVGSSTAGPREADPGLVTRSKYFVDSIESAKTHASEFLYAREQGLVTDQIICGEIGSVIDGKLPGRCNDTEITVYKSLGHIAQDLAVGWYVYQRALVEGFGVVAPF
jgi:ornithine cyclodeaminase